MSTTVSCDKCQRPIVTCGYRVTLIAVTLPEVGEVDVEGDYCSTTCLAQHLGSLRGRRPDFAGTRRKLDEVFELDALDDAVDSGLLDDDEPEFESERIVDDVAEIVATLPRGRRSHSMLAADAVLAMQRDREAHA